MKRSLTSCLLFPLLAVSMAGGLAQQPPGSPAEQFATLKREYETIPATGGISNDDERLAFIGRSYQHHFAVARKLVDWAGRYPNDPLALEALTLAVWQVNTTPWPVQLVGEDTARAAAFEQIQRDHLDSAALGPLCQRVSWGFCREYDAFLRAVLASSPHRNVAATACLSLGRFLSNRQQRVDLCREQPILAREFEGLYGREYLAELLRQDRDAVTKEMVSLFERAAGEYADAALPDGAQVADRAQAELFGIRHLSVGKEAPDIEGADAEGKRFKLSDYRGKVVLLDFWSFV